MSIDHTPSSGNVFQDLGLADADERLKRSTLSVEMEKSIVRQDLSYSEAAGKMGIPREKLVSLVKGNFNEADTVEQLEGLLQLLNTE